MSRRSSWSPGMWWPAVSAPGVWLLEQMPPTAEVLAGPGPCRHRAQQPNELPLCRAFGGDEHRSRCGGRWPQGCRTHWLPSIGRASSSGRNHRHHQCGPRGKRSWRENKARAGQLVHSGSFGGKTVIVGLVTCGAGAIICGIVDAVLILTDKVRDPAGRPLRDGT